jgi:DNA-binding NarL/FixJ family response regulator
MINILLVEDHNLVRDGIKSLLRSDPNFNVVDVAANGKEALQKLQAGLDVSIVLTDINMPGMDGFDLTRAIKSTYAAIHVIILTMVEEYESIQQAFTSGASGYLLKIIGVEELIFAVKHVSQGQLYLCSHLSINLLQKNRPFYETDPDQNRVTLTAREAEILKMVSLGMTNNEIANKLFTSKRTVEGHRQNLLSKTGTKNTAALIRYAVYHKYLLD